MEYRREEGRKLEEFFTQRIRQIENLLAEVPRYENERVSKIRARIEDNLAKLGQVDIDLGRLEQEMIYYIEKPDINEEKQRLRQHLTYFMETLDGETGQGKNSASSVRKWDVRSILSIKKQSCRTTENRSAHERRA